MPNGPDELIQANIQIPQAQFQNEIVSGDQDRVSSPGDSKFTPEKDSFDQTGQPFNDK